MRGNDQVIAQLNNALKEELTAINQYFLHAEMCHNWGYHKLGDYIKKQSIDEMKHAEELIERILFLDATPDPRRGDVVVEEPIDFRHPVERQAIHPAHRPPGIVEGGSRCSSDTPERAGHKDHAVHRLTSSRPASTLRITSSLTRWTASRVLDAL